MPSSWTPKEERMYKHIVKSCEGSRPTRTCKRIAAATVNKRKGLSLDGIFDNTFYAENPGALPRDAMIVYASPVVTYGIADAFDRERPALWALAAVAGTYVGAQLRDIRGATLGAAAVPMFLLVQSMLRQQPHATGLIRPGVAP